MAGLLRGGKPGAVRASVPVDPLGEDSGGHPTSESRRGFSVGARLSASVQFGGEGLPESRRFDAKDSRLVGPAGSATAGENLRQ